MESCISVQMALQAKIQALGSGRNVWGPYNEIPRREVSPCAETEPQASCAALGRVECN